MQRPERKLNRHRNFDYSLPGFYFTTICTTNMIEWFGEIVDDKIILNKHGQLANNLWLNIPRFYKNIELDEFMIMPNHIHGIIRIMDAYGTVCEKVCGMAHGTVGTEHCSVPTGHAGHTGSAVFAGPADHTRPVGHTIHALGKNYGVISKIVKSFKNEFTNYIRKQCNNYEFKWQRSFYDEIIRDETALNAIRMYIKNNPSNWRKDRNNFSKT